MNINQASNDARLTRTVKQFIFRLQSGSLFSLVCSSQFSALTLFIEQTNGKLTQHLIQWLMEFAFPTHEHLFLIWWLFWMFENNNNIHFMLKSFIAQPTSKAQLSNGVHGVCQLRQFSKSTPIRSWVLQCEWELLSIFNILTIEIDFETVFQLGKWKIPSKRYLISHLPRNSTRPMRFALGFGRRNSRIRTVNDMVWFPSYVSCYKCSNQITFSSTKFLSALEVLSQRTAIL